MAAKKLKAKAPETTTVKVRVAMKEQIEAIGRAMDQKQWEVMDDLLKASLPARWNAVQPILKKLTKAEVDVGPLRAEVLASGE